MVGTFYCSWEETAFSIPMSESMPKSVPTSEKDWQRRARRFTVGR